MFINKLVVNFHYYNSYGTVQVIGTPACTASIVLLVLVPTERSHAFRTLWNLESFVGQFFPSVRFVMCVDNINPELNHVTGCQTDAVSIAIFLFLNHVSPSCGTYSVQIPTT